MWWSMWNSKLSSDGFVLLVKWLTVSMAEVRCFAFGTAMSMGLPFLDIIISIFTSVLDDGSMTMMSWFQKSKDSRLHVFNSWMWWWWWKDSFIREVVKLRIVYCLVLFVHMNMNENLQNMKLDTCGLHTRSLATQKDTVLCRAAPRFTAYCVQCAVLCWTVLYCAALYCAVLCPTVLYCAVLHYAEL